MSIDEDREAADEGARVTDTGVLRFSVSETDDVTVVTLVGELDLASTAELSAAFDEVVAAGRGIVVDMAGLAFIDSTGMAVIVRARKAAEQGGATLTLRRVQANVAKTLALAGLDKVFTIEE